MSSYADVTLGSLCLATSRNGFDPTLMWLFRQTDKRIELFDRRDRARLMKYIVEEAIDEFDEHDPFACIEYRCSASKARDRLDLKGYTREVAESGFKQGLKCEIERIKRSAELFPSISGIYDERLKTLNTLTISSWLKALERIWRDELTEKEVSSLPSNDAELPLLRYMLGPSGNLYGFPGEGWHHFWLFARLAVEAVPPQEQLVYDLSNVVYGGWVNEDDDLVFQAESQIHTDLQLAHRVIILTEGDTDKRILERSLKLLYPHLADYFHFFDFTGKKVGGGVGQLANLVRAFAAADVQHRILALFDNDTAAKAALSNLLLDSLPKNISVRRYPDIALAQDYPTVGPSGETTMDINGLAGSIELYLGQDVLVDAAGVLSPVQWTGYDHKLGVYQGAISQKDLVLRQFNDKLAQCEGHPEEIDSYDWEGIRAILDTMRTAFHSVDEDAILSSATYE